jgi:hypothetical protein
MGGRKTGGSRAGGGMGASRGSARRTVPLRAAPERDEMNAGASEDMFAGAEERDTGGMPPDDDDLDQ